MSAIECPKCGKHTLLQRQGAVYECLNCRFKVDLDKKEEDQKPDASNFGRDLFLGLLTGTFLFVLLQSLLAVPEPQLQPQSSGFTGNELAFVPDACSVDLNRDGLIQNQERRINC